MEPFAGAAGYATRYADRNIVLVEKDPMVAALWRYLVTVNGREILALPDIPLGGTVDDLDAPAEARSLIGFWLNKGAEAPRKSPSSWMRSGIRPDSYWGPSVRERLAWQVERIRHWRVIEGSYEQAPPVKATWFVDPPYAAAGRHYRIRFGDYDALADWCRSRSGQVIVCENAGATWLPFSPFGSVKGTPGARRTGCSPEVYWTNDDPDSLNAFMFGDDD